MQKALETTSGSGHKERSLIASVFCKRDAKKHGQLFFHPDFTVGSGFAPDQSLTVTISESRALDVHTSLPPVGNFTLP